MKRFVAIILLSLILLCGCSPKVSIDASTTVTRTGTVTDLAMASEGSGKIWDKSYPYLGVEFEDGSGICLWNKMDTKIPEEINIGDTVTVTYGLHEGIDHYILIEIKEMS